MEQRLWRLVAVVAVLAVLLQLTVALVFGGAGAIAPLEVVGSHLTWAEGWLLVVVLLGLCVVGDLSAVRLRHGEEIEELTLAEAAIVVVALLLPPAQALLLPVLASLVCSVVRRRDPIKVVFNAANLAAAGASLVAVVHVVSDPSEGLSVRTVVGLVLGMAAFTLFNSIALARVMAIVGGADPWEPVREGLRLSLVMAIGTVGLGATFVTLAGAAPALLPFSVMPAAALTFAFKAAAQELEERQRSARLTELSHVLAGRLDPDEVLEAFLRLTRQAFGARVAAVVLDPGELPGGARARTVLSRPDEAPEVRDATAVEEALLVRAGAEGGVVLPAGSVGGLLDDAVRALLAPLEADGRRLGAVVLATEDRHRALGGVQLTLLTPLASALAVALRGAAHLRRLTEETSKLQAVVDHSSDGILVLDGSGRVQLWSPALTALTGRDEAAAVGRPPGELVQVLAADGGEAVGLAAGAALLRPDAPQATVEVLLVRDDGEQRVVRCAHAGVFDDDGRLEREVVIVHDVTRERQVERLKADFIATVSHELRTPVTPIKGYADLLRRRGDQMTPEKRSECLEVISDRATHLARLVEDLLLASRISATEGSSPAQVEMGREDLVPLVLRACQDFGLDGERVTARVPDGELVAACDRVRVIQVLTNMVGNALKYSTPGTPVEVVLTAEGGRARVTVTDRGRGIPADQLEKVFEKFHRVEDPMRMTTGGTGLGLYIARQLTTAMGGSLSCTSVLGVGSTFVLELPLEEPAAPVAAVGAAPAARPVPAASAGPAPVGGAPLPRPRRAPPWATPPPHAQVAPD